MLEDQSNLAPRFSYQDATTFGDFKRILQIVTRRFWVGLLPFLAVVAALGFLSMQKTPRYTAATSLIIDPRASDRATEEGAVANPDSILLDTEVKIIKSTSLIRAVVQELELVKDPEFNPFLQEPSALDVFKSKLPIIGSDLTTPNDERLVEEHVVDLVKSRVHIARSGTTFVVEIRAESEDRQKAMVLADGIAGAYLAAQTEKRARSISQNDQYLKQRIQEVGDRLRDSENLVEEYRTKTGLLDAKGSSVSEQQIADLSEQLVNQKAALSSAIAKRNAAQRQLDLGLDLDLIQASSISPVLGELRRQQVDARTRKSDLTLRFGAQHPDLIKVQNELENIEDQMREELLRISENLSSMVNIERNKVYAIQSRMNEVEGQMSENNVSRIKLEELEREADANRTLYQELLKKYKGVEGISLANNTRASIISAASYPTRPSYPNRKMDLLAALLIAALVGGAMMMIVEAFDQEFRTADDLERNLKLPHIVSVPKLTGKDQRVVKKGGGRDLGGLGLARFVNESPNSRYAQSLRTIRSFVNLSLPVDQSKIISVMSSTKSEGKTTTAIGLATTFAQTGMRTLLMDCDTYRHQLTSTFVGEVEAGLAEVLSGKADIERVLHSDPAVPNLDVLPVAAVDFIKDDIFGGAAFKQLLDELRQHYEVVVLDTPPVLAAGEARLIAKRADAAIMVTKWRESSVKSSVSAKQILDGINVPLIGCVMNSVDYRRRRGFGVEDTYYYKPEKG